MAAQREVWSTWRFELKYKINNWQYHQLRNALRPYMEPDEFTRPGGDYLVRSLYYDTFDYQAYHEKMAGAFGRIKLRIRAYADVMADHLPLRVELKTRRGSAMEKFSTFIPPSAYMMFSETGHWPAEEDSPVLIEFARLFHLRTLRPKLLVQYRREGMQSRKREDLRITFDHKVCSSSASSLFPAQPFFRNHCTNEVILEIKCRNQQPAWLANIVRQHGLKVVANSKFTQGIEMSRPDVVTPMWSQGYIDRDAFAVVSRQKQTVRAALGFSRTKGLH